MSARDLTAVEKAEVARFGIHDEGPRWKVACINWPHRDAPHAVTYLLIDGGAEITRYHDTWEDAIAWLDDHRAILGKLAASRRIGGGQ